MRSPLDKFHKPIVLSPDPEAKYYPSHENTTVLTISECPIKVLMRCQFDIFHTLIVLSQDPEAKYSPSGENTTLKTE